MQKNVWKGKGQSVVAFNFVERVKYQKWKRVERSEGLEKKELILCSIAHIPWCSFLGSELYLTWSFNPYPLTKIKTRKAAGEEEDNGMCTKVETNIMKDQPSG